MSRIYKYSVLNKHVLLFESLWICCEQKTQLSQTMSINYFKMSAEPPNQSQLELSFPFQSKRGRWGQKDLDTLTTFTHVSFSLNRLELLLL